MEEADVKEKVLRVAAVLAMSQLVSGLSQPFFRAQNLHINDTTPAEIKAVLGGVPGIEAFVQAGGRFTGQKNANGHTAAMFAAASSPEVIKAFAKAGGRFTDDADAQGQTAAMEAARQPQNIPAFIQAGGHFDLQQAKNGDTAGMIAIESGVSGIKVFAAAGGKFTSQPINKWLYPIDIAKGRGPEVLAAYREAVTRQGGLIYMSTDDEFTALRSRNAIESFVKAGGHFDYEMRGNWTAAMDAVMGGPDIVNAFAEFGGKFTTQRNPQGNSAEDFARQRDFMSHGILNAYLQAVKRQGELITLTPDNEYEAARIGAPGIEAFVKAGGHLTGKVNKDDLTSAMLAAENGAAAIDAFHKAGGRFTTWQNSKGYSAAMIVVMIGPDAISAYARAGGQFTDQQDEGGRTAAMWAASANDTGRPDARTELKFPDRMKFARVLVNRGDTVINAFAAAGGRFTDQQDNLGLTAAMSVLGSGPEAVKAFAHAGGHFTDQQDNHGTTAEMYAVSRSAAIAYAFAEAGGKFTGKLSSTGGSSEFWAAMGEAEMITAYSEAGGVFTDRKYHWEWTSEMLASDKVDWMLTNEGRIPLGDKRSDLAEKLRPTWQERFGARDIAAAAAYKAAVIRQGGLRHVP